MTIGRSILIIAVVAGVAVPAGASAGVLSNGGFETPIAPNPPGYATITAGNFVGAWKVPTGDVNTVLGDYNASTNLAKEGNQYLDLIGESGSGAIEQSFATIANKLYTLTFSFSHNVFSVGSASFVYAINGVNSQTYTHNSGDGSDLDWQTRTVQFVATGSSTTLGFINTAGNGTGGAFLDAVSVAAVPEPASWAMMIAGFGLVGGMARRRRQTAALA